MPTPGLRRGDRRAEVGFSPFACILLGLGVVVVVGVIAMMIQAGAARATTDTSETTTTTISETFDSPPPAPHVEDAAQELTERLGCDRFAYAQPRDHAPVTVRCAVDGTTGAERARKDPSVAFN